MPKVSVIIPVYNVEKYLRECLNSVINQTLKDIEIIIIDDGGKDNCPQIIDEYAQKDSRIIAIHKDNGGYGQSCNIGLDKATGEYIAILEPDDFIDSNMYEDLYNIAKNNDSDIVKSPYYAFYDLSEKIKHTAFCNFDNIPQNKTFKINECPQMLTYHPSIWSAIYKTKFIRGNNIRFIEAPGAAWADNPFFIETYCKAEKINYIPNAYYHYRILTYNSSDSLKDYKIPFERFKDISIWLCNNKITDKDILANIYNKFLHYIFLVLGMKKYNKEDCILRIKEICSMMDSSIIKNSKYIKKHIFKYYNDFSNINNLICFKYKLIHMRKNFLTIHWNKQEKIILFLGKILLWK